MPIDHTGRGSIKKDDLIQRRDARQHNKTWDKGETKFILYPILPLKTEPLFTKNLPERQLRSHKRRKRSATW